MPTPSSTCASFLYHSLIISTAEHEAHYVIDGLMHNDVVKSDIHSTDTGGYSEILFGAMHYSGLRSPPGLRTWENVKSIRSANARNTR